MSGNAAQKKNPSLPLHLGFVMEICIVVNFKQSQKYIWHFEYIKKIYIHNNSLTLSSTGCNSIEKYALCICWTDFDVCNESWIIFGILKKTFFLL